MVTTDQIKELREATGVSVMQCKKALEETGGDMEKALVALRKKGREIAEKKSDRELLAGAVHAYVHQNKEVGTLVHLACETDFVAKHEDFVSLVYDIAMHVAAMNPTVIARGDIAPEREETAKMVLRKEVEKEAAGKPEEMREKILQGKLDAYFKDSVLLEQAFVKDSSTTIQGLLEAATQKFGEKIQIASFTRVSVR